jgi:hypothetical protein
MENVHTKGDRASLRLMRAWRAVNSVAGSGMEEALLHRPKKQD